MADILEKGRFDAFPSPQKMHQRSDYVDFKGFDIDQEMEIDEDAEALNPTDRAHQKTEKLRKGLEKLMLGTDTANSHIEPQNHRQV